MLQQFLPLTQSLLVFAARSCRDLSSWHWNPGLGSLVRSWDSLLWGIPPEVLSTTRGWVTNLFHLCVLSTSVNGRGFFNSVVVRLPFNLISGGSAWQLFCISAVILMWLWEEASRVCLCRHLDQQSSFPVPLNCLVVPFTQEKQSRWLILLFTHYEVIIWFTSILLLWLIICIIINFHLNF